MNRIGEIEKARWFQQRAIAVLETTFGPKHPELAAPLDELGDLLLDAGEHEAARALARRAAEIRERLVDPNRTF